MSYPTPAGKSSDDKSQPHVSLFKGVQWTLKDKVLEPVQQPGFNSDVLAMKDSYQPGDGPKLCSKIIFPASSYRPKAPEMFKAWPLSGRTSPSEKGVNKSTLVKESNPPNLAKTKLYTNEQFTPILSSQLLHNEKTGPTALLKEKSRQIGMNVVDQTLVSDNYGRRHLDFSQMKALGGELLISSQAQLEQTKSLCNARHNVTTFNSHHAPPGNVFTPHFDDNRSSWTVAEKQRLLFGGEKPQYYDNRTSDVSAVRGSGAGQCKAFECRQQPVKQTISTVRVHLNNLGKQNSFRKDVHKLLYEEQPPQQYCKWYKTTDAENTAPSVEGSRYFVSEQCEPTKTDVLERWKSVNNPNCTNVTSGSSRQVNDECRLEERQCNFNLMLSKQPEVNLNRPDSKQNIYNIERPCESCGSCERNSANREKNSVGENLFHKLSLKQQCPPTDRLKLEDYDLLHNMHWLDQHFIRVPTQQSRPANQQGTHLLPRPPEIRFGPASNQFKCTRDYQSRHYKEYGIHPDHRPPRPQDEHTRPTFYHLSRSHEDELSRFIHEHSRHTDQQLLRPQHDPSRSYNEHQPTRSQDNPQCRPSNPTPRHPDGQLFEHQDQHSRCVNEHIRRLDNELTRQQGQQLKSNNGHDRWPNPQISVAPKNEQSRPIYEQTRHTGHQFPRLQHQECVINEPSRHHHQVFRSLYQQYRNVNESENQSDHQLPRPPGNQQFRPGSECGNHPDHQQPRSQENRPSTPLNDHSRHLDHQPHKPPQEYPPMMAHNQIQPADSQRFKSSYACGHHQILENLLKNQDEKTLMEQLYRPADNQNSKTSDDHLNSSFNQQRLSIDRRQSPPPPPEQIQPTDNHQLEPVNQPSKLPEKPMSTLSVEQQTKLQQYKPVRTRRIARPHMVKNEPLYKPQNRRCGTVSVVVVPREKINLHNNKRNTRTDIGKFLIPEAKRKKSPNDTLKPPGSLKESRVTYNRSKASCDNLFKLMMETPGVPGSERSKLTGGSGDLPNSNEVKVTGNHNKNTTKYCNKNLPMNTDVGSQTCSPYSHRNIQIIKDQSMSNIDIMKSEGFEIYVDSGDENDVNEREPEFCSLPKIIDVRSLSLDEIHWSDEGETLESESLLQGSDVGSCSEVSNVESGLRHIVKPKIEVLNPSDDGGGDLQIAKKHKPLNANFQGWLEFKDGCAGVYKTTKEEAEELLRRSIEEDSASLMASLVCFACGSWLENQDSFHKHKYLHAAKKISKVQLPSKMHYCTVCHESFLFIDHFLDHLKIDCQSSELTVETVVNYCGFDNMAQTGGQTSEVSLGEAITTGSGSVCKQETVVEGNNLDENSTDSFCCKICQKKCSNLYNFLDHILQHKRGNNTQPASVGQQKLLSCEFCPMKFPSSASLKVHTRLNHFTEMPMCPYCHKHLPMLGDVVRHCGLEHPGAGLLCDICAEPFLRMSDMLTHRLVHVWQVFPGELDYTFDCPSCNVRIKNWEAYKMHVKIHTVKLDQDCHLPLKKLKLSVKSETLDECESGDVTLFDSSKADGSMFSPNEIKVHLAQCDICERTFHKSSKLKKHMKEHHNPKETKTKAHLRCNLCKVTCKTSQQMKVHKKSPEHYTAIRSLQKCTVCGRTCLSPADVRWHEEVHSGKVYDPLECQVCHRIFKYELNLRKHTQSKHRSGDTTDFNCSLCAEGFNDMDLFLAHLDMHKGRKRSIKRMDIDHESLFSSKKKKARIDKDKKRCKTVEQLQKSAEDCDLSAKKTASTDTSAKEANKKLKMVLNPLENSSETLKKTNKKACKVESPQDGITSADEEVEMELAKDLPENLAKTAQTPSKKWIRVYKCPWCNGTPKGLKNFVDHCTSHHPGVGLVCDACGKHFKKITTLLMHRVKHMKKLKPLRYQMNYECPTCSLKIKSAVAVRAHEEIHSKENGSVIKNNTDSDKPLNTARKDAYRKVITTVKKLADKKSLHCKTCDIDLVSKSHFNAHKRSRLHREKLLKTPQCDVCGQKLWNDLGAKCHKDVHSGKTSHPFQCSVCLKIFKSSSWLVNHICKQHSLLTELKCMVCSANMDYMEAFVVHLKTHSVKDNTQPDQPNKDVSKEKVKKKRKWGGAKSLVHVRRSRRHERAKETEEQRSTRLQKCRERARRKRETETQEQRALRLSKAREYQKVFQKAQREKKKAQENNGNRLRKWEKKEEKTQLVKENCSSKENQEAP